MDSTSALKSQTDLLCASLKELENGLIARTVSYDDAQRLWNSTYRPQARRLAEAMVAHVPNGDPRIFVQSQIGNQRILQSDAINCIESPFSKDSAETQLLTVHNQLRDLTKYLPTTTHNP